MGNSSTKAQFLCTFYDCSVYLIILRSVDNQALNSDAILTCVLADMLSGTWKKCKEILQRSQETTHPNASVLLDIRGRHNNTRIFAPKLKSNGSESFGGSGGNLKEYDVSIIYINVHLYLPFVQLPQNQ